MHVYCEKHNDTLATIITGKWWILASCPWVPATAHGKGFTPVLRAIPFGILRGDVLIVYKEPYTSHHPDASMNIDDCGWTTMKIHAFNHEIPWTWWMPMYIHRLSLPISTEYVLCQVLRRWQYGVWQTQGRMEGKLENISISPIQPQAHFEQSGGSQMKK